MGRAEGVCGGGVKGRGPCWVGPGGPGGGALGWSQKKWGGGWAVAGRVERVPCCVHPGGNRPGCKTHICRAQAEHPNHPHESTKNPEKIQQVGENCRERKRKVRKFWVVRPGQGSREGEVQGRGSGPQKNGA